MRPADRAWLVLGAGVLAWDLACPHGQTLSAGCARYHQARPWITRGIVLDLAAHLLGIIPARGDPLNYLTYWKRPRP